MFATKNTNRSINVCLKDSTLIQKISQTTQVVSGFHQDSGAGVLPGILGPMKGYDNGLLGSIQVDII